MFPEIIMHNSISLDGSYLNFEVNMGLHYKIAGQFEADAHLIGSVTAKTGIEAYTTDIEPEKEQDFQKPLKKKDLPYYVIVDSKGQLDCLLHVFRSSDYCQDVIVLITNKTPSKYIDYLDERDYGYIVTGNDFVDLKDAIQQINQRYNFNTILTDSGKTLNNILINEGLIKDISLLIHPVIVGHKSEQLFNNIKELKSLRISKYQILDNDYIWVVYRI